jgi:hypothetical protein
MYVDNLNFEELVEDDDNDDGDICDHYKAMNEKRNENKRFYNEDDVGLFNEDRASSLNSYHIQWNWNS